MDNIDGSCSVFSYGFDWISSLFSSEKSFSLDRRLFSSEIIVDDATNVANKKACVFEIECIKMVLIK